MPINHNDTPIVLTISGHDPSGGAGVMADAEAISHHGCHPCSILTCLTVQDSTTVHKLSPLDADGIVEQANVLFNDMPIAAIKIGLTGSVECVSAIVNILSQHPNIPVIFDPVLACGDGTPLANKPLVNTLVNDLLPLVTVLTPNTLEASTLSGLSDASPIKDMAIKLLQTDVDYVLITGGHTTDVDISNHLFHKNQCIQTKNWARQAGEYHGTGCTLASAIAALIAKGLNIEEAVGQAQSYTDNAIRTAQIVGKGQAFPNRLQKIS
ncbi:MAG: hydroxymethylpyrimidine/phosphomethylpyrimidine kinase [Cycloclasticus sp.]|nr:MAG: hydroxymethylpyrimidine/phosphomethylpyrimidine kinase [Cycloclasticus sp.]